MARDMDCGKKMAARAARTVGTVTISVPDVATTLPLDTNSSSAVVFSLVWNAWIPSCDSAETDSGGGATGWEVIARWRSAHFPVSV